MLDFTQEEKDFFMSEALKEAEKSLDKAEIPIGCVIVKDGEVVGRGHNAREELNQAIMHAEVMAIQEANRTVGNWRLLDCTLFVTIEPCVMCSGAIGLARIPKVIYGASNQKFGGAGSLYDILRDERLNHRVEVETGVMEEECAKIMQDFFRQSRERKKEAKRLAKLETRQDMLTKVQVQRDLHFLMEEECFCFPEGSLGYSFYAFLSLSLVKRKIGIKRIRVPKADFKLVSIIGVPNRT